MIGTGKRSQYFLCRKHYRYSFFLFASLSIQLRLKEQQSKEILDYLLGVLEKDEGETLGLEIEGVDCDQVTKWYDVY